MGYLALRPIPVGKDDVRQPGDPIPEAADWPNLKVWIATGKVGFVADGHEDEVRACLQQGKLPRLGLMPYNTQHQMAVAARHISGKVEHVPGLNTLTSGGKVVKNHPKKSASGPGAQASTIPPPEQGVKPYSEKELKGMTRGELDEVAAEEFSIVNASEMPNKQAVIDAILGA